MESIITMLSTTTLKLRLKINVGQLLVKTLVKPNNCLSVTQTVTPRQVLYDRNLNIEQDENIW